MTKNNLIATIDALGELQAQIATLAIKEKELKDSLKDLGAGSYEGDLFRATVSIADRCTLDSKACKAKLEELGVPRQWFTANTKTTSVTSLKVSARNGDNLSA